MEPVEQRLQSDSAANAPTEKVSTPASSLGESAEHEFAARRIGKARAGDDGADRQRRSAYSQRRVSSPRPADARGAVRLGGGRTPQAVPPHESIPRDAGQCNNLPNSPSR